MDWNALESRPGSFSKNFGWQAARGLGLLHRLINIVFQDGLQPTRRDNARALIQRSFTGDPLVPLNFFLYNQIIGGTSYLIPDQLIVQALVNAHDERFDHLAIVALNISRVGTWVGARGYQAHPAPWARAFVTDVLYDGVGWNPARVHADTIETFLVNHFSQQAPASHKYATNLHSLYQRSGILDVRNAANADWWAAAVFLFLDRATFDGEIRGDEDVSTLVDFLDAEEFWALTAISGADGRQAAANVIEDYQFAGGTSRLSIPALPAMEGARAEAARGSSTRLRQPRDLGLTAVQRAYIRAQVQVRRQGLVTFLRGLYEDRCSICGNQLRIDAFGSTYAEAGHVRPVGRPFDGPDSLENLLLFCPNHHKMFDRGGVWFDTSTLPPRVRSGFSNPSINGRPLSIKDEHNLDLNYLQWHARYFGHLN